MPTQSITGQGKNLEEAVRDLGKKTEGQTQDGTLSYTVRLEGEKGKLAASATAQDYDAALRGAQAAAGDGNYQARVYVEGNYAVASTEARPSGAAPSEPTSVRYSKLL